MKLKRKKKHQLTKVQLEKLNLIHNVAYGLHSNIPVCCIAYWLLEYTKDVFSPASKRHIKNIPDNVRYIACPRCLQEKTFVKLHECSDDHNNQWFENGLWSDIKTVSSLTVPTLDKTKKYKLLSKHPRSGK